MTGNGLIDWIYFNPKKLTGLGTMYTTDKIVYVKSLGFRPLEISYEEYMDILNKIEESLKENK